MAKKESKPKIALERTYNIPLRKEWLKAPKWKRTKKAVKAAKEFLQKHMKSDNVKLSKSINDAIWKHGGKNPPHHIKVDVSKDEEGLVTATLSGAPKEEKIEKPKKEATTDKVAKEKEEKVVDENKEKTAQEKPKKEEKKEQEPAKETPKTQPKKEEPSKEEIAKLAKDIMQKGSTKK